MNIQLRPGWQAMAPRSCAHCRQRRRRPPAAAVARGRRGARRAFVVAVDTGRDRPAPSWRRSARKSPKSARSSSTSATRPADGRASGDGARRTRADARLRRRSARSRTSRRTFVRLASRSCRTCGCPRRSRTTASAAPVPPLRSVCRLAAVARRRRLCASSERSAPRSRGSAAADAASSACGSPRSRRDAEPVSA